MEEAGAGLVTTTVLAVRWWLERWLVVVGQVVKMAAMYRSGDSSSQSENFQRILRLLICCVDFCYLWQRQLTMC